MFLHVFDVNVMSAEKVKTYNNKFSFLKVIITPKIMMTITTFFIDFVIYKYESGLIAVNHLTLKQFHVSHANLSVCFCVIAF